MLIAAFQNFSNTVKLSHDFVLNCLAFGPKKHILLCTRNIFHEYLKKK